MTRPCPEVRVPQSRSSVADLVTRLQLPKRASTVEFSAGVRMARARRVGFDELSGPRVQARVDDEGASRHVTLTAEDSAIVGSCDCHIESDPCRHQVAAAHALWVRQRDAHPFEM
jgi:hypothetical protein